MIVFLPPAPPALRVDLNSDPARGDVRTPGWENWAPKDTPSATQTFGQTTVTLRASGAPLGVAWWKAGYDTGATLASDGVVLKGSGHLELSFSGLTPGKHTLVTYHNRLESTPTGALTVAGKPLIPSVRTTDDADATTAFTELVVGPSGTASITLEGTDVVLNGFALDVENPQRQPKKPLPADGDEHAPEEPTLSWTPATGALSQTLYLGTSPERLKPLRLPVSAATTKGLLRGTYFWRVDTRFADGKTVRGPLWSFRIRQLAFPGAEGYGRFAIGGRGGKVYEVTNLNDSGPGSLREAVEASGPRTVVFRVAGTITLRDRLTIKNPYLTVAGETAPGEGICVRGASFGNLGTHDTILRHIRVRVGDASGRTYDGMGFASSDHCIIDHCSISWTIDESVSSRGAKNVTLQRCLIGEALNLSVHDHYVGTGKGHSFAASISGKIGSFHHNLLVHCAGRNFSLAGGLTQGGKFAGYLDIRNNVVYNWEHRTNDGGVKALNLINNYYLPGPATRVFHLLKPDVGSPQDPQQYFVEGNVLVGYPDVNRVVLPKECQLAQAFCEPFVTTQSAEAAFRTVLADVGCNYAGHDAVDLRLLGDVERRGFTFRGSKSGLPGIIDSQNDVGGWPTLKTGQPPTDSDHDGIPDSWEREHRLDPKNPRDGAKDSGDGYTWLERYLHTRARRP